MRPPSPSALDHAETKVLITDKEFSGTIKEALALASAPAGHRLRRSGIAGTTRAPRRHRLRGLHRRRRPGVRLEDARRRVGRHLAQLHLGHHRQPKGVVYHHRGAYLLAQGNIITAAMGKHPVYLWTLPMFHCNGWCFPWSISVVAAPMCACAGCARSHLGGARRAPVTHLCGAPIVMSTLLNAPEEEKKPLAHTVEFFTAAAPPPEAVLAAMADAGFNVTHLYGLTETYGPAVVNDWKQAWDACRAGAGRHEGAAGRALHALEGSDVMDPETMQPCPPTARPWARSCSAATS
jgi:fatty-acyl-CoA synthase